MCSREDCHLPASPYCLGATKRPGAPEDSESISRCPGGEAPAARNRTSPWEACPAVQIRNTWHTLLCIHNHLPTQAQMKIVSVLLMPSCERGRPSLSFSKVLGIVQFLETYCTCIFVAVELNMIFRKTWGQDHECSVSAY